MTVDLGPGRKIDVFAEFDALEYGSTTRLLSATLADEHARRTVRDMVRLGGRPAARASFAAAGKHRTVVAQQLSNPNEPINLVIDLTTDVPHQAADRATLGQMLRSFRRIPRD